MAPLVSIIIPAYNCEPFIAATLESALDQSWPACEVIVVDDGSTDRSRDIIDGFRSRGVVLMTQANAGGSAARNAGFRRSRGSHIQFLDHDDLLHRDKIREQMARSLETPGCPVAGPWIRFLGDASGAYGGWNPPAAFQRDTDAIDWLTASPMVPTCAWLTPRQLVEDAGLWNDRLKDNPDDDGEFFMRVFARSPRVLFAPEGRSYFRADRPASAGHNRDVDALRAIYVICESYERLVRGLADTPEVRRAAARRYLTFMYMAYPRCPELIAAAEQRVAALGFADEAVPGTPGFERLSRIVGWRVAKRLQSSWHAVSGLRRPRRSHY
ncbi:MAG TPA: glycosyltransferase family A protein [Vicinamibacterales bacterium]|nr:glycosyltransferase family A protein [Vicinamibacterales bacterium]